MGAIAKAGELLQAVPDPHPELPQTDGGAVHPRIA
jgi:hypothetical protein